MTRENGILSLVKKPTVQKLGYLKYYTQSIYYYMYCIDNLHLELFSEIFYLFCPCNNTTTVYFQYFISPEKKGQDKFPNFWTVCMPCPAYEWWVSLFYIIMVGLVTWSLFRNKRFMLDEIVKRNAWKIVLEPKGHFTNPKFLKMKKRLL